MASNDMIVKIMKFIPNSDDFEHMLELSFTDIEPIIGAKPVFSYSQEEVINMSKPEYREKFAEWETETREHYRNSYSTFERWNRDCLLEMPDKDLDHLVWLCDHILNHTITSMDIVECNTFTPHGLYFDKNKRVVICSME